MSFPGPRGLSTVLARIQQIDALIARLDPASRPLMGSTAAGDDGTVAGTGADGAPATGFSAALADVRSSAQVGQASPSSAAAGSDIRVTSPLPGATLTQAFGPTTCTLEPSATIGGVTYAHYHDGLDLAAPLGTPVLAAADGQVIEAGTASDGAVVVGIRHADGSETRYAHLQAGLPVRVGEAVHAGEVIGRVGMTGNTTGPHLHFELWRNGVAVDPQPWITAGRLPGVPATGTSGGSQAAPAGSSPDASSSGRASTATLALFDRVAASIPYGSQIEAAAADANVDPFLLASLVRAESGFDPNAVSSAGAEGLTQLMPVTAQSLGVSDAFDPVANLEAGARYLAGDLASYGRVDLALAAYESGRGAVAAAGGVPDSFTTRSYISRILSTWTSYLQEAR